MTNQHFLLCIIFEIGDKNHYYSCHEYYWVIIIVIIYNMTYYVGLIAEINLKIHDKVASKITVHLVPRQNVVPVHRMTLKKTAIIIIRTSMCGI